MPIVKKHLFHAGALRDYMIRVLESAGVSNTDAAVSAEVLLSADMRGVESHGIIRLFPYYSRRLRQGLINPHPTLRVVNETPAVLALDGDNGLGHPTSCRAMEHCIARAQEAGAAVVTVRNSNHYGIAGYYAMMALGHDMIGLSFTNASPLVAPTYGRTAMLGTNPIAVAAPAGREWPYVLDMATSIVPIGKVTVYEKAGRQIPYGWGIDGQGEVTTDPLAVFHGGALMPLGGTAEMRGYKGYGLALLVEILCGVLSGSAFGAGVDSDPHNRHSRIGHCFAALRIDAFRPLDAFKQDMDALFAQLTQSPKAAGHERIYIHGEKEFERSQQALHEGVPVMAEVVRALIADGLEAGVPFDLEPVCTIEEVEV